jgi:hypothetical protein
MAKKRSAIDRKEKDILQQQETKKYIKPKLTEYGKVEKITGGATGPGRDFAGKKVAGV